MILTMEKRLHPQTMWLGNSIDLFGRLFNSNTFSVCFSLFVLMMNFPTDKSCFKILSLSRFILENIMYVLQEILIELIIIHSSYSSYFLNECLKLLKGFACK